MASAHVLPRDAAVLRELESVPARRHRGGGTALRAGAFDPPPHEYDDTCPCCAPWRRRRDSYAGIAHLRPAGDGDDLALQLTRALGGMVRSRERGGDKEVRSRERGGDEEDPGRRVTAQPRDVGMRAGAEGRPARTSLCGELCHGLARQAWTWPFRRRVMGQNAGPKT